MAPQRAAPADPLQLLQGHAQCSSIAQYHQCRVLVTLSVGRGTPPASTHAGEQQGRAGASSEPLCRLFTQGQAATLKRPSGGSHQWEKQPVPVFSLLSQLGPHQESKQLKSRDAVSKRSAQRSHLSSLPCQAVVEEPSLEGLP